MLIELEGISQANAIVILIVLRLHDVMEHRFDIHISDIISQQDDFITMNLVLILAQHILLLDDAALKQARDKGACACKWVKNVYILIGQRSTKFTLQDVFNRVDDEVHTFYWCIDDTQLFYRLRECSLEEFLIEILDDGLLAFEVINITYVVFYGDIELLQNLSVHLHALTLQHFYHILHGARNGIVIHKLVFLKQGIEDGACYHVLCQHTNGIFFADAVVDILVQTTNKLLKVFMSIRILFYQEFNPIHKLLSYIANRLTPVLPIHLVAHLLNKACIDAILQLAKLQIQLTGYFLIIQMDGSACWRTLTNGILTARYTTNSNLWWAFLVQVDLVHMGIEVFIM